MTTQTITAQARIVNTGDHGKLDVSSLILLAVLLAAGFILNITVGNALAITGIKPQFIIAAYALAIILTRASFPRAVVFGIISAAVIQFTTYIPGPNFLTELVAALVMAALVRVPDIKVAGHSMTPFVATLLTTFVSGALFASLGTVIIGAALAIAVVKVPIVLGTAVFNAAVVQALSHVPKSGVAPLRGDEPRPESNDAVR